jgi:hypothetical protein
MRRLFLVIFMSVPLAGAALTGTSLPVLLAMGALILFALTVAMRNEGEQT